MKDLILNTDMMEAGYQHVVLGKKRLKATLLDMLESNPKQKISIHFYESGEWVINPKKDDSMADIRVLSRSTYPRLTHTEHVDLIINSIEEDGIFICPF